MASCRAVHPQLSRAFTSMPLSGKKDIKRVLTSVLRVHKKLASTQPQTHKKDGNFSDEQVGKTLSQKGCHASVELENVFATRHGRVGRVGG